MHLAQVEEQEAAAVPRGDLGRGGRVYHGHAGSPRDGKRGALAPAPLAAAAAPEAPRAPADPRAPAGTRPRVACARRPQERTLIDWLVLVKCTDTDVGRDQPIYKDCEFYHLRGYTCARFRTYSVTDDDDVREISEYMCC